MVVNYYITFALLFETFQQLLHRLEQELKSSFDECNRVLLSAHKTMRSKKGLKIKNVGEDIMEIFQVINSVQFNPNQKNVRQGIYFILYLTFLYMFRLSTTSISSILLSI